MEHVSVLLHESIDLLDVRPEGIYVDCTLGRGGHSLEILKRLTTGKLFAFDVDPDAIRESKPRLESTGKNFEIVESNFENIVEELGKRGISEVDGILADLGVSSPDFDDASRGFSYSKDGPLDMRMDPTLPISAYDVVNTYGEDRLSEILRDYGEEREARKIAKAIVRNRSEAPIRTTRELAEIVKMAKSPKERAKKGHPAKQSFQAIRIEVNHELVALEKLLNAIPGLLAPGGRAAVISFHSLEDRLVKKAFKPLDRREHVNRYRPGSEEDDRDGYLDLTPHPILPSREEIETNPRAASSKLRGLARKGGSRK